MHYNMRHALQLGLKQDVQILVSQAHSMTGVLGDASRGATADCSQCKFGLPYGHGAKAKAIKWLARALLLAS